VIAGDEDGGAALIARIIDETAAAAQDVIGRLP
jgi:hypothetical protein